MLAAKSHHQQAHAQCIEHPVVDQMSVCCAIEKELCKNFYPEKHPGEAAFDLTHVPAQARHELKKASTVPTPNRNKHT